MRRPAGHIRERSRGSWEIRYSLGTDPATGKRRTVTTLVKGKRETAEKELRRLLRTVDTGEHVDPTRMTVREWLTTWLEAVRAEISPKSHERYSEIVQNFLSPSLGNTPMRSSRRPTSRKPITDGPLAADGMAKQAVFRREHANTSIGS